MCQITVDHALCKKDGACVAVCPSKVLLINEQGYPEQHPRRKCILCGHCVAVCMGEAMTHSELASEEFMPVSREKIAPEVMDGFLESRRSVREFKPRALDEQTLSEMLLVARRAPTASNSQLIEWSVARGPEKVHAIAEGIIEAFRAFEILPELVRQWEKGIDFVLRGAPNLVVAHGPASHDWLKEDGSTALAYLELSAEARGIGACWTGYLTRAANLHAPLRRLLGLPEDHLVAGGLMLGPGTYRYRYIPPRKPLSVHWV